MHGSEHGGRKSRALRRSASHAPVSRTPGSMLSGAPQGLFDRGRSLVTAFPSPATAPALASSIPGSTVPACYFASALSSPAARSTRNSTPAPVGPGSEASASPARCGRFGPRDRLRPRFHSPFGTFTSPGIKAFDGFAAARPAFHSARFPFAPRSPFCCQACGRGSSFPVRCFPEACCSSNLLEPSSICSSTPLRSISFPAWAAVFLSFLLLCSYEIAEGAE
jgi:hypothetical protein